MSIHDDWTKHEGEIIHQVTLAKLWHHNLRRVITTATGERRPWTIWRATSGSKVIFGLTDDGATTMYLTKTQRQGGKGVQDIAGIISGEAPSNDTPVDDDRAFEYVRSNLSPSKSLLKHAVSGWYLYSDDNGKLRFTKSEALADDWQIDI